MTVLRTGLSLCKSHVSEVLAKRLDEPVAQVVSMWGSESADAERRKCRPSDATANCDCKWVAIAVLRDLPFRRK